MYVRRITRRRKDGSVVGYLQLAHKVRDAKTGKPRDVVLHHFGPESKIDKEQLKRLIKSIARFLPDADRAATQVGLDFGPSVSVERSQKLGGSHALDGVWRRLGLDRALQELARERSFGVDVERLIFTMVAGRALDPSSKLALERWVGRKVAIDGLDEVSVQQLYRAMDFLVEHGEAIQKAVFFSTASLLNLQVDLLFFDTTSTYFELDDADDDGLRRFGHSKDHRRDRPQVVVGLAVTRDGLPVRCWVLPGNTADASLVARVQEDLAGWRLNRVVWVMDRGMTGEDQKLALQRGGGHYIVGEKLRANGGQGAEALSRPGRYKKVRDNLEVKDVEVENGSDKRRYVVVRNPKQAQRDATRREATLTRLEAELDVLNRRRKDKRKGHSKAVCALKSHRSMGRYVRELKNGELRIDRAKVKAEEKLDGKYMLSTSDFSLSAEDVALGYKQLIDVERAFRTLKSTLELRPVYHRRDDRITSHVLLCWLALLLVRVVERETGETWENVRDTLDTLHRVDVRTKEGRFLATTTLTSEQRKALKALGVSPPKAVTKLQLSA